VNPRWQIRPVFLAVGCVLVFLWALKTGSITVTWRHMFIWIGRMLSGQDVSDPAAAIVFYIRLPRVLMAAMVGALLAAAGNSLQALFRNPLADPYLLGISGGAALGAATALLFGLPAPAVFSCLGAAGSLGAVIFLSRMPAATSVSLMVLAGAAVHSFTSAVLTLLLSQVSRKHEAASVLFWLLGSLDTLPYSTLLPLLGFSLVGLIVLFLGAPALNLLAQGEEAAQSLGLSVERAKWFFIGMAALLTGLAVTFNGMIPFVGLVVPHIARLLYGPDHRLSLPLSAALGALLVVVADTAGRVVLAPQEIPTGVITALGGAPYFLYILRRERKKLL